MLKNNRRSVSIGIVALNEEEYLPDLLNDLLLQSFPKKLIEVVLIDSGSSDNTLKIYNDFKNDYSSQYLNIMVLHNEKRKQACGWNVAISNFTTDALIRIDAHARIPVDFVENNISYLSEERKVVGGLRSVKNKEENNKWQNTLLLAELSMFGSSIAGYRRTKEEKCVNSMFHACYSREVLEQVKFFNEYLGRTEDNEFHYRIREAGYKLFYNSEIISYQLIRSNLKRMLKQKYGNGYWIGLTVSVCPKCLSAYHFIPFLFVMALFVGLILLFLGIVWPITLLCGTYFLFDIINTLLALRSDKANVTSVSLIIIFPLLHIVYGVGTLIGLLKIPFWKEKEKARNKNVI